MMGTLGPSTQGCPSAQRKVTQMKYKKLALTRANETYSRKQMMRAIEMALRVRKNISGILIKSMIGIRDRKGNNKKSIIHRGSKNNWRLSSK